MTMTSGGSITRAPRPSSLADVLDLILDKGLVVDAYVRVSAVGIELLTIDARIVIASVDTYLHYAEAVNRLDLANTETRGITGLFGDDDSQSGSGEPSNGKSTDSSGADKHPGRSISGLLSRGSGDDEPDDREADDEPGDDLEHAEAESGEDEADEDETDEGSGRERRGIAARLQDRGRWSS